jgi:hypothetical protein
LRFEAAGGTSDLRRAWSLAVWHLLKRSDSGFGWTRAASLHYRPAAATVHPNVAERSGEFTMMFRLRPGLGIGWVLLASTARLAASDFAIQTQVYEGNRPELVAENLTVFSGPMIYDFGLTPPERVAVLDTATRQFHLACPEQRIQTLISADQLLRFVAAEHSAAETSANELVRFAAAPTFTRSFDPASGQLGLSSPCWDYQVQTLAAEDETQLDRYLQFAHWFTYLNALFRPIPPGVRLQLNQALHDYQRLPSRVVVRIKREGQVVLEQESRHQMIGQLSDRERKRIERWDQQQPQCHLLSVQQYRSHQKEPATPSRR